MFKKYGFSIKLLLLVFCLYDYYFLQEKDFLFILPRDLAQNFLVFLYGLLGIDLLEWVLKLFYQRKRKVLLHDNYVLGLEQFARIISFNMAVLFVLSLLQINIKQLFTTLSIVAAAIALLTKDYITQMISGMIITFTNHLSLNDHVKINGHKGKITDIDLFNVHLMNEDDDLLLIPNLEVFNAQVVNYSKRFVNKVGIDFEVDIEWFIPAEDIEKFLKAALAEYGQQIDLSSCHLKVVAIEAKLVRYKFLYILNQNDKNLEKMLKKILQRKLISFLQAQGANYAKNSHTSSTG